MCEKQCRKCGAVKPLDSFYKQSARTDGHASNCKTCSDTINREYVKRNAEHIKAVRKVRNARNPEPARLRAKVWRLENPERNAESTKKWKSDNPERWYESAKKWYLANPEKKKVHRQLRKAVLKGEVIKVNTCQACGVIDARIEGHHPDYSKPLEVIWLCRSCHQRLHARQRLTEQTLESASA